MSEERVAIPIPMERLADCCRRWGITELALFGSVLRDDFGPASDVDVLVTFAPSAGGSALAFEEVREELSSLFGRSIDLVQRPIIERHENPWKRHGILSGARVIYSAA